VIATLTASLGVLGITLVAHAITVLTAGLCVRVLQPLVHVIHAEAQLTFVACGVDGQAVIVLRRVLLIHAILLKVPGGDGLVTDANHGMLYAEEQFGLLVLSNTAMLVIALVGVSRAALNGAASVRSADTSSSTWYRSASIPA